jgi:hypothetical protein
MGLNRENQKHDALLDVRMSRRTTIKPAGAALAAGAVISGAFLIRLPAH